MESSIKNDISTPSDVKALVDTFYHKVNQDDLLSPIFNDVAHLEWKSHLPRTYKFWNSIIFEDTSYSGNPFQKHIPLPIGHEHFERWLGLFSMAVDELYEGSTAEHVKLRARSIGHIFEKKLAYITQRT